MLHEGTGQSRNKLTIDLTQEDELSALTDNSSVSKKTRDIIAEAKAAVLLLSPIQGQGDEAKAVVSPNQAGLTESRSDSLSPDASSSRVIAAWKEAAKESENTLRKVIYNANDVIAAKDIELMCMERNLEIAVEKYSGALEAKDEEIKHLKAASESASEQSQFALEAKDEEIERLKANRDARIKRLGALMDAHRAFASEQSKVSLDAKDKEIENFKAASKSKDRTIERLKAAVKVDATPG